MNYCRYCSFCILGDWYYCTCHDKVLKKVNRAVNCADYHESELGDVDTGKKYSPRPKYKQLEQIALQIELKGVNDDAAAVGKPKKV